MKIKKSFFREDWDDLDLPVKEQIKKPTCSVSGKYDKRARKALDNALLLLQRQKCA
jgi:hypothetical protein